MSLWAHPTWSFELLGYYIHVVHLVPDIFSPFVKYPLYPLSLLLGLPQCVGWSIWWCPPGTLGSVHLSFIFSSVPQTWWLHHPILWFTNSFFPKNHCSNLPWIFHCSYCVFRLQIFLSVSCRFFCLVLIFLFCPTIIFRHYPHISLVFWASLRWPLYFLLIFCLLSF